MAVILLIYNLLELLTRFRCKITNTLASIHSDFEHMITRHIVVEANNQRASNKYTIFGRKISFYDISCLQHYKGRPYQYISLSKAISFGHLIQL